MQSKVFLASFYDYNAQKWNLNYFQAHLAEIFPSEVNKNRQDASQKGRNPLILNHPDLKPNNSKEFFQDLNQIHNSKIDISTLEDKLTVKAFLEYTFMNMNEINSETYLNSLINHSTFYL